MRVLFTTWAWPTHYQPLVTLAWSFRAAGHEVRVASQPSLVPTIQRSGLPAITVGTDESVDPIVDALLAVDPHTRGPGDRSRTVSAYAEIAETMVEPLLTVLRGWRPDLVVFEESTYAGPLAAQRLGIPAVRHLWGVDILSFVRTFEAAALAPAAARIGLDGVDPAGLATVDHCMPSLQVPGDFVRLPMRYVPFNGASTLPTWSVRRPARPRVAVTYGTTSSRLAHYEFVLPRILRAVASLPVEVVATVAGSDLDRLGAVPSNVRVVERMPLHALLPSCDLLISQAGPSTALTAAACGRPQLMIPQLPDQRLISTLVAAAGAGVKLDLAAADEDGIRTAAERLLASPTATSAAARLRAESERQPGPAEVVARITDLVGAAG